MTTNFKSIEDQLVCKFDTCDKCGYHARLHTEQDDCVFRILHSELQNRNKGFAFSLTKTVPEYIIYKSLLNK